MIADVVGWVIDTFEGHLYTDDPVDTGGATKFGITRRTLEYYRRLTSGNPRLVVTKADVEALTRAEAVACGVAVFAVEPRIAELTDLGVQLVVYDFGFHSGQDRAVRALQTALGFSPRDVDGQIDPKTIAAANAHPNQFALAVSVLTTREEFMHDLMVRRETQKKYLFGWWRRTTRLQRAILPPLTLGRTP